jgi:hypothetical protein
MWICPRCGSNNVQFKQWVHANTGELMDSDIEDEDCWCDDCETHNALITKDIPVNNKVIGFQVCNSKGDIHPEMDGSFCIYSLAQAQAMLERYSQNDLRLLAIRKRDIEEPTMMFTGDLRD